MSDLLKVADRVLGIIDKASRTIDRTERSKRRRRSEAREIRRLQISEERLAIQKAKHNGTVVPKIEKEGF